MVPNMDGPQEVAVLGSREKLKIIFFQLFVISFNYLTKYVSKTKLILPHILFLFCFLFHLFSLSYHFLQSSLFLFLLLN